MDSTPKLNFPPINLRAKRDNNRTLVFDCVRSMYVVLTPEEWVRRHLVEYLINRCGAPLRSIVEEYPVNINGMPQRADIVAMDSDAKPMVVVECKEPNVRIDQTVLDQVVRYNSVLRCRYIVITNGIECFSYAMAEDGSYTPLDHFPHCAEL